MIFGSPREAFSDKILDLRLLMMQLLWMLELYWDIFGQGFTCKTVLLVLLKCRFCIKNIGMRYWYKGTRIILNIRVFFLLWWICAWLMLPNHLVGLSLQVWLAVLFMMGQTGVSVFRLWGKKTKDSGVYNLSEWGWYGTRYGTYWRFGVFVCRWRWMVSTRKGAGFHMVA